MGINGVIIQKGGTGASVVAPATSTSALLFTGFVVAGKLALNTTYSVTSLKQAETLLGITSNYDTTNNVVVHQHIKDFYSYPANKNVKLYLMCLATNAVPATVIEDTTATAARKLITEANGEIKQLGFAYNLAVGAVETIVDGLNSEIRTAIAKAQALYDWAYTANKPCNILLEGRNVADNASTLLNLRNIPAGADTLSAKYVSVVIGQDLTYANGRTGLAKKYAGVGKALGNVAAAEVNQSIAEVDAFNLSDAVNSQWLVGGLSNNKTIAEQDALLVDLDAKGYIFPITRAGRSGLRWNGDHTCTPIVIDEDGNMNEHQIYYGRTMDLAVFRLRTHLTKLIKARVVVDTKTGKLPTAIVKQLEADADVAVFGKMATEGFISGGKTIINANSAVQPPTNKLQVNFELVPTAIVDDVEGTIFLKKTLSI